MTRTVQLIDAIGQRAAQLARERDAAAELLAAARRDWQAAPDAVDEARHHLVDTLLPSIDTAVLDAAAARIRLPKIGASSLRDRMLNETRRIDQERAQIERDDRFRRAEQFRATYAISLQGLDDAIAPLAESVNALEAMERFVELVEVGYGTESYPRKFWQLSYYRDWEMADLVVEAMGERMQAQDFATIAATYRSEREALLQLQSSRDAEARGLAAVEAVVARFYALKEQRESLGPRTLSYARTVARTHLSALADDDLLALFRDDPTLDLAARRVLSRQRRAAELETLVIEQLQPHVESIDTAIHKLRRQMDKLRRPKYAGTTWPDSEIARRIGRDRRAALAKHRMRFHETHVHILQIDETYWDRGGRSHSHGSHQHGAAFVASGAAEQAWAPGLVPGTTTGWDGTEASWSDVS